MTKEYRFNSFKEALKAVRRCGGNLEQVRPDLITPRMAMIAVKDLGWELEYVPAHLITPELALEAVRGKGWNLEFVPAHCQTQEVIEAALEQNPSAKKFIKTKGLMMNALGEALDE